MRRFVGVVAVVAAGCGGHGAAPDAAVDAARPSIDATVDGGLQVTVEVSYYGLFPAAQVPVYFQDGDSRLVAEVETDGNGRASAPLGAGGFVTVLVPDDPMRRPGWHSVSTIAGVVPGDHLHFMTTSPDLSSRTPAVTFTLAIPADPGKTWYQLDSTCGGQVSLQPLPAQNTITLTGCHGSADFLITAGDASDVVETIYQRAIALTDGASITIDGPYQPLVPVSYSFSNATEFAFVSTGKGIVGDVALLLPIDPNHDLVDGAASFVQPTTANDAALELTSTYFGAGATPPTIPGLAGVQVIDWGPPQTSYAFDASVAFPPVFTAAPTWDRASRAVRWGESPIGATPEAVVTSIVFPAVTGSQGDQYEWDLCAPHRGSPVAIYPIIPGDRVILDPNAAAAMYPEVRTFVSSLSWDELRGEMFAGLGFNPYTNAIGPLLRNGPGRILYAQNP